MTFDHWHGRRFYSLKSFFRRHFGGEQVGKIPIDGGFTCPNLDGSKGTRGCIYCNNHSFSPAVQGPDRSVREQVEAVLVRDRERGRDRKYLAYFQAYSNTYGSVDHLARLYEEALDFPEVVGLDIGTRPDCVSPEILGMIEEFARRYMVWIEYGLQSAHELTLKKIHRRHTVEEFDQALSMTVGRGIHICGHLIYGFPWESRDDMLASASHLAGLDIDGIKFHHLYVARDTALERAYHRGKVPLLTWEEYRDLVCDSLEILGPDVAVHRMVGDLDGDLLVAPHWNINSGEVYREVNEELERRGTWQGCRYADLG